MSNPELVWFCERKASYRPLESAAKRLLAGVPGEYLGGLRQVVFCEAGTLTGRDKRKRISGGGRSSKVREILGRYHGARHGGSAWVELFVDNMVKGWPTYLLRLSPLSDFVTAQTLYHELGHHIHSTLQPVFKDREAVAEDWARRLSRSYFSRRYFYLRPFAGLLRWTGKLLRKLSHRRKRSMQAG